MVRKKKNRLNTKPPLNDALKRTHRLPTPQPPVVTPTPPLETPQETFKDASEETGDSPLDIQLLEPEFTTNLELLTLTRVKTPSKLKMLHAKTQTFIQSAQEKASVISFGLTITYPLDKDYLQSWGALRSRIQDIVHRLYHLPIYCLLLTIEIHKEQRQNKSDKDKKRRPMHQSRLKGRPHLHLCLMLYNDFLCPSINHLQEMLEEPTTLNADLQVTQFPPDDSTKGLFHIKNWFLYCLKEAKDSTSQRFLNKYLNFSGSAFLLAGHPDCFNSCSNLAILFNQSQKNLIFLNNFGDFVSNDLTLNDHTFFNRLPFVPQTDSDVLKVSHFLNTILKRLNLAIWPGKTHLAKLTLRAKATWEEDLQLSQLYTLILQKVPVKAQELLINSRPFNLNNFSSTPLHSLQSLGFNFEIIRKTPGMYVTGVKVKEGVYEGESSKPERPN